MPLAESKGAFKQQSGSNFDFGGIADSYDNCLFAQDITAVTAELKIRFRHALELEKHAIVRAWVKNNSNTLYIL